MTYWELFQLIAITIIFIATLYIIKKDKKVNHSH